METNTHKEKLLGEKNLIEKELGDIAKKDHSTGLWVAVPSEQLFEEADENDMADREEDFEERSSTVEILSARLHAIEKALKSIEEGTYGVCKSCGNKIEEDRLEANSAASTCKACMNKVL